MWMLLQPKVALLKSRGRSVSWVGAFFLQIDASATFPPACRHNAFWIFFWSVASRQRVFFVGPLRRRTPLVRLLSGSWRRFHRSAYRYRVSLCSCQPKVLIFPQKKGGSCSYEKRT